MASNGCGCLAFLLGSTVAVALFGAHLLSGWGARAIERVIGQYIDGTVEVTGVELSWRRPQQARSVSIISPDDKQVIHARLTLPSLLDLIGEPEGELVFTIEIIDLESQIDADGTSDLGRTFGLAADDGRTVVEAVRERVASFLTDVRDSVADSSLRVELVIDDAFIVDNTSGQAGVRIEALTLVARVNRIGAQIDLSKCELRVMGVDGVDVVRTAGFDAIFEYDEEGRLRLQSAAFESDPLPRSVLRTLGIVPRVEPPASVSKPRSRADIHDVLGARAKSALAAFMSDGASILATFGPEPDADVGSPGAAQAEGHAADGVPRLSLVLNSSVGQIVFDAELRDGALVPVQLEGGRAALWMDFVPPLHAPASIFEAIVPPAIHVHDDTPGLRWMLESRDFRLSVDESALTIGGGDDESEAAGAEGLAAWLRSAEAHILLRNAGGEASRLHFDSGEGYDGLDDRLEWEHRLTELTLMGDLGGWLRSTWKTNGPQQGTAHLEMTLPGRALGPDDAPGALIDAWIPGMTLALLDASVELPRELRVMLPRRLHQLDLHGVPVSRFISPGRGDRSSVGVDVWTGADIRFRGRFEDGVFHVPSARFPLVISEDVCDALLLRMFPWLSAIEPLEEGAELTMTMREFEFTPGSGEFRESGEATIEAPPMRVKLQPGLARYFKLEDPDSWIEWTPASIELSLERGVIRYRSVELPLGDDVEPSVMTGRFDREDKDLSLTGLVDARSLSSSSLGAGLLPVEITVKGAPESLQVTVDLQFAERALNDMLDRVRKVGSSNGG